MTYLDQTAGVGPTSRAPRPTMRGEAAVIATSLLAACLTCALWAGAGGVDLEVHAGNGVRSVGIASVAVSTGVVALAGALSARLLARSSRGLRWWTVLASVLWPVSVLGPLGATTVTAGLALTSLHVVVGAIVLVGVRRVHADHDLGRA